MLTVAIFLFLVLNITVARVHVGRSNTCCLDAGLIITEVNSHLIHLKGFAGDCG